MNKRVYLDYSATTPMKQEVLDAMMPYFNVSFGNPSSIYTYGRESKGAIDKARDIIAKSLNSSPDEIFFTAGGSESDNWAVKGIAYANRSKGKHIITTNVEHHAVLHTCEYLEKEGYEVTYLSVDEYGLISIDQLKAAIRPDTILITIMFANNEIGTIQPIKEIGQIARNNNVYFHTDAVQAYGNMKIDVNELGIDLMSVSAHKLYGPKGTGALYIKKGVKIHQLIHGGGQEKRRRAGTENVPGIVGFAKAVQLAHENLEDHIKHITSLRDKLITGLKEKIQYLKLNGHPTKRLPGNVNYSIEFVEGESLLLSLDMVGIACSSGSACTSGSLDPSHVLMAIGLTHEVAHGSLRLTVGDFTSEEDIDYVIEKLPPIVEKLRQMSPLYEKVKGGN
ncbi:cysteine desulfurase NifS [Alkaliphilus peptidifermentans]|uniref:Cysteine desulfurase IscS n=1 Tax=Alkaliphilus peptidifermentans DSM 18978 TaxID=1120976 RepID=A0A1G5H332_9FIRM|nr:cysteine desulfurase NifS [Alkaliphilus peptidifermentans]SCY58176.1 cysteine desulfurase [Alkaliphilus peptidifermentans DSM 18978]